MRKALVSAIYLSAASLALASDLGGDGLGGPTLQPRANSAQLGEPGLSNRETAQVDPVLIEAGEPALDFRFAENKWMRDSVTNKQSLITFSRSAAQSPGTYVGADGLIHDAPVNLALYSEQFDNAAWVKSGATVEANQKNSPDGKQTADRFTPTATNAVHSLQRASPYSDSGNFSNYSLYVKADGYTKIALRESKSYGSYVSFDLSAGTVLDAATVSSGKLEGYGIEDVGDGWYRIHANFGDLTLHRWGLFALPENYTSGQPASSWLANGTDGYFIWGAQLEETDAATMAPTAYIKTTSQALAAPRFDHEPTTGNLTTNLVTYSEMLDVSSAWTPFNSTVTANATTDPDGGTNADRVTLTNGNLRQKVSGNLSGQTFTYSFYAKTVSGNLSLPIHFSEASTPYSVIGSDTISVTNDWQKFAVTVTLSATSQTQMNVWFGSSVGSGSTGDFYVYQAQLEASPTAGPYVRTLGETRSISDAVAPSLGLLVEEQRANYIPRSEQIDLWLVQGGTPVIDVNVAASPKGTQAADSLSGGLIGIFPPTLTAQTVNYSVYAKPDVGDVFSLVLQDRYNISIDLGAETYSETMYNSGVLNDVSFSSAGNGWKRVSVTTTHSSLSTVNAARLFVGTDSVLFWGAQLEAASFPSSYIPTTGTSQTRYADIAAVQDEDFATTNLISYSESFDVGWTTSRITINENLIDGPFPGGQADEAVPFIGSGAAYLSATPTGTGQTFSVYVKPNGVDWLFLSGPISSDNVWFDLQNVAVGTKQPNVKSASIQSIGNGWLLLQMTSTSSGSSGVGISLADADNTSTVTGDGTIGLYLWGASLTATEYPVEYTTTRNLLTDSQDFERSTWVKSGAYINNDVSQAPDGTNTADKLREDLANAVHRAYQLQSGSFSGSHTVSVYVKAQERDAVSLRAINNASANYSVFDLSAQTITNVGIAPDSATMTDVGDGWFRITRTDSPGSFSTRIAYVELYNGGTTYLGDNTSGILVWGAQLEPGTTATDYVRTVDTVGKAYGFYEPTEGTVFVGIQSRSDHYGRPYKLGSANSATIRTIDLAPDGSKTSWNYYKTSDAESLSAGLINVPQFVAISYQFNNYGSATRGVLGTGDTSTNQLAIPEEIRIGALTSGSSFLNGHIKRLTYWPTRQADTTLQVITQ